jgi:hypothetical protein
MVTVTNFAIRKTNDDRTFVALELTGGVELVQSQSTGNFYATVRKCSIPSTFDENIAKMMIGQQIEGDVVRVEAEPYDYVNKQTGEIMILQHSFAYRPKGSIEVIGETKVQDLQMA